MENVVISGVTALSALGALQARLAVMEAAIEAEEDSGQRVRYQQEARRLRIAITDVEVGLAVEDEGVAA